MDSHEEANEKVNTNQSEQADFNEVMDIINNLDTKNTSITCEVALVDDSKSTNTSALLKESGIDKMGSVDHIVLNAADVSKELQTSFQMEQLKTYDQMTSDEMWSILLLSDIPEGDYYPIPEKMVELQREPFFIKQELVQEAMYTPSILPNVDEKWGYKPGTSVLFKGLHQPHLGKLFIPWCIQNSTIANPSIYKKNEFSRIDWYCPWFGCGVQKTWFLLHSILQRKKPAKENYVNYKKWELLQSFINNQKQIPHGYYLVIEVVSSINNIKHKHFKGAKGGERVTIHNDLKKFAEVKESLQKISQCVKGPFQQMFTKSIAPIVQMAQAMINIPEEAFLGGFTDIAPHKISCYQKENSSLNKKMMELFDFKKEDGNIAKFKKMMDIFAQMDTIKRKELAHIIPFNATKCVVGYIQQVSVFSDNKWSIVCASEAQILSLLADLEIDRAFIWDGTDPNTKREDGCLMFPILTRAAYGTGIKRNGNIKASPGKVVARLFTNIYDASPQIEYFQTLIEKSKYYSSKPLDLKGVVVVTDMDKLIPKICQHFGMVSYWERRHVNQSIVRWAGDKYQYCLSFVLTKISELRNCMEMKEAQKIVNDIETLLNLQSKHSLSNNLYCPQMWEYLQKYILYDLDKICRWTVAHLSSHFWEWSQAIESRNNVDLNIWNFGKTNIAVEECIYRYQQIDKAEIREAYLRYLQANFAALKNAVSSGRKNISKKALTAIVTENLTCFDDANNGEKDDNTENGENTGNLHNTDDDDDDNLQEIEQKINPVIIPTFSQNAIERVKELKELLENQSKKKKKDSNTALDSEPKTVFGKPSKIRKRNKPDFPKVSEEQNEIQKFFLDNDTESKFPVEKQGDKIKIADYYLWNTTYLRALKRSTLMKLCAKYNIDKNGKKKQLITNLLKKKEELMEENNSKTVLKQLESFAKLPPRKKRKKVEETNQNNNENIQSKTKLPNLQSEIKKFKKNNNSSKANEINVTGIPFHGELFLCIIHNINFK